MNKILILLLISFYIAQKNCQVSYNVPGDKDWPTYEKFKALQDSLQGELLLRGEKGYETYQWNQIRANSSPAAILKATNVKDIKECLKFAKDIKNKVRISVKGSGNNPDSRHVYDNSILIDMSYFKQLSIMKDQKILIVGAGNTSLEIIQFLSDTTNNKLVALTCTQLNSGIFGWLTAGGYGYLTRLYGLGVDALLEATIITADGSEKKLSNDSSDELKQLFRSIKGGGGSAFGIVTSLKLKLFDNPGKVSVYTGSYLISQSSASKMKNIFDTFNMSNNVMQKFKLNPVKEDGINYVYIENNAYCFGDQNQCQNVYDQLSIDCIIDKNNPKQCNAQTDLFQNYHEFFLQQARRRDQMSIVQDSTILPKINQQGVFENFIQSFENAPDVKCEGFAALGGVSAEIDSDQTQTSVSLALRKGLSVLWCYVDVKDIKSDSKKVDEKMKQVLSITEDSLGQVTNFSVYWNFSQHNIMKLGKEWTQRYWGGISNYSQLLAIKEKYDLDRLFNCFYCVGYKEQSEKENPLTCPDVKCSCDNNKQGVCSNISTLDKFKDPVKYRDNKNKSIETQVVTKKIKNTVTYETIIRIQLFFLSIILFLYL